MKTLSLIIAAYLTLVCETVLAPALPFQAPAACWAWLVLPWLAVAFPDRRGIIGAALFGLTIDCLAEGLLGPSLCLSVLATFAMQRFVTEKTLQSATGVGMWTFLSCSVSSSVLSAIQVSVGVIELPIQTVAYRVAASSATASIIVVALTSVARIVHSRQVSSAA